MDLGTQTQGVPRVERAFRYWATTTCLEFSDTRSHYVAQPDFKPSILRPLPSERRDYRCPPPCLAPASWCLILHKPYGFLHPIFNFKKVRVASLPKMTESEQYIKVKNTDLLVRPGRANLWPQNSKAESGKSLSLGQPGLYSNFLASQGYIVKPCLKINKYLVV